MPTVTAPGTLPLLGALNFAELRMSASGTKPTDNRTRSAMSEKRTVKVVLQQMKTCRSYILINREQVSDKKGQTKCENTGARPVSVG